MSLTLSSYDLFDLCCVLYVSGGQELTNGTISNIAKVEGKIPEPVEKDNTAIIQSMQYLQNIAAATTYPGLGLTMQQRQDLERPSPAQQPASQINNFRP